MPFWFGIAHRYGGLAYGYGPVSVILTVLIIGFVAYLGFTSKDVEERAIAPSARRGKHRVG